MLARHTAVLGTLLLSALGPGVAGRQSASAPAASPQAQEAAPAPKALAEALAAKPVQTSPPAKPRNYLALLPSLPFHPATIVIDPSHGGVDGGSRISDGTVEKDVTLALAFRLRSLLVARGFTVVLTRDSDDANQKSAPFAPLTLDDRAGLANHERAGACLLLHATASGIGVHLYSSELEAASGESVAGPWLTAQAAWVPQSQRLAGRMSEALTRARLPLINASASVRPLDSLTCPALVIELAPNSDDPDSINDGDYQQRVAEAITGALVFWKNAVQPPPQLSPEDLSANTEDRR